MNESQIGLALSGGGFRAACFGLGCMRALHDQDLLRRVSVISGISGGSLLAAYYAYGPTNFHEFDGMVVEQLRRGLQLDIALRAANPLRAIQNSAKRSRQLVQRHVPGAVRQRPNRTDALIDALESQVFAKRTMNDVSHHNLATVITATDLVSNNAMRFGSLRSSCSAYGTVQEMISVADAVAASAAFPTLLPGVERTYTFDGGPDGALERHDLILSDGGIYDNLGTSPFEPGRSVVQSPHVYDLDYIIACDAGRGRLPIAQSRLVTSRLKRSFDITYRRAQDASRARLHQTEATNQIKGFVHAYLGMPDSRLPKPVSELVPYDAVKNYPTDFKAMDESEIVAISLRGEQLTRTLLAHYCPSI